MLDGDIDFLLGIDIDPPSSWLDAMASKRTALRRRHVAAGIAAGSRELAVPVNRRTRMNDIRAQAMTHHYYDKLAVTAIERKL